LGSAINELNPMRARTGQRRAAKFLDKIDSVMTRFMTVRRGKSRPVVPSAGSGATPEPWPPASDGKLARGAKDEHARCSLRRSVRIGGERILVGPDAHQENVGAPLTTY
jgi:hypothetical protein